MRLRLLRYLHPLFHRRGSMKSCLVCRIVWKRLLSEPGVRETLEEGIADLKAGRIVRWADIRRDMEIVDSKSFPITERYP